MAKVKQRKDSKGRVLQKGESQRKIDGMYIYTYVDPYGKRCYVYSKDLFTLREKEQDLIRCQMDGLDFYVGGRATINMAFDRYMSTKYNLRETTRSNYIYMYNRFVRDEFGNRLIADVKYTDVKMFYYHLMNDKNIAVNTLDNIHTIIHPIFDMAVRDDIIRKNPTDGVMAEIKKNSGKNKGIRHALTVEQQKAFIDAIRYSPEYYHWYPLFVTLLGTGMRIGECIGLRWKDVDFKHRNINVNHAVTYYTRREKVCFGVSKPKTEAGTRLIPMMDTVYDALKNEYDRQKKDGFCVAEVDGMNGFIFSNRNGSLHNPHCINSAIKRISESHNAREIIDAKKEHREPVIIPHFSAHHLRHTFCSRLCENETNVKVIQEIMGHANIETTLDIYTEINYSKKQESLEELSKKIDFF
ncbi:MAG: tyrosine-type recombinase/integrase [Clostridiales bacterium]|nr:tyrosine-type recombinase/integrase [Clostridiales bacterium]